MQSTAAGAEGYEQLRGEQWNDALKAAMGEKTLIVGSSSIEGSEGKIKKALKKREKQKAKSAQQWNDRIATKEDDERAKQHLREHNLQKRIMKKKGVDIDAMASSMEETATGGSKPSQPPQKRPRLFMVQKYKEADEKNNNYKGTGGAEGREGGSFKGGGGGGRGHQSREGKGSGRGNRAGFEGKKRTGEYLNK